MKSSRLGRGLRFLRRRFASSVLLLVLGIPAWADLAKVKAEPDANRRVKLALENADAAITAARAALDEGRVPAFEQALQEVDESVALNLEELGATGKGPRKSGGLFKWSEVKMRGMLRRLEGLVFAAEASERPKVEAVRERMSKAQDTLVETMFTKKKRN